MGFRSIGGLGVRALWVNFHQDRVMLEVVAVHSLNLAATHHCRSFPFV
jgi:hypothetical protein